MQRKSDIVVVTETWLYENEVSYIKINNYSGEYLCRNGKRGGGVAIFVSQSIKYTVGNKTNFDYNSILSIKLHNGITIVAVYRQPTSPLHTFLNELENIVSKNNKSILIGDFNIDITKASHKLDLYLDIIKSHGYDIINDLNLPTRVDVQHNKYSIIDHFITNLTDPITLTLDENPISDHKLMNIDVKIAPHKTISMQKYIRCYIPDNLKVEAAFEKQLQNTPIQNLTFEELINITASKTVATKTKLLCRTAKNTIEGWYTAEVDIRIKKRNKYYKMMKKYPSNNYIKNQFKKLQREVKYIIRLNKKEYISNKYKNAAGSIKQFWKVTNNLLGRDNKKDRAVCSLNIENRIITDPDEISNQLNKYFVEATEKLTKQLTSTTKDITLEFNTDMTMYLRPTTETEMERIIGQLKINAAPGYDGIKCKTIRKLKHILAPYLVYLINKNFKEGIFPDALKIARIRPIYKIGSQQDPNNYRPISVLNAFSKIIEKLLLSRLHEYLNMSNFFDATQNGFLEKKGTQTAVARLIEAINEGLNSKMYIRILFLDLRKAFDLVNHEILIKKLEKLGINGPAKEIFRHYLTNRTQYVNVGDTKSNYRTVTSGVPQGSILGPLLFNIYVNDLTKCSLLGRVTLYADDAVILYAGTARETLKDMKNDIHQITEWTTKNKLLLNEIKCAYMNISNGNNHSENEVVEINNIKIEKVNNMKYLGLTIDDKLNYVTHISKLNNKLRSLSSVCKRIGPLIDDRTRRIIYMAFIKSHLTYLANIWGDGNKRELDRLQRTQNIIIKHLFALDIRTSTETLYNSTKFLKTNEIIRHEKLKFIYKLKNNLIDSSIHLQLNSDMHYHNTRNSNNIHVNQNNNNAGRQRVIHGCAVLFNDLPTEIREAKTYDKFKALTKEHIIKNR